MLRGGQKISGNFEEFPLEDHNILHLNKLK